MKCKEALPYIILAIIASVLIYGVNYHFAKNWKVMEEEEPLYRYTNAQNEEIEIIKAEECEDINIQGLTIPEHPLIAFCDEKDKELMRFESNGEIYWKDKLITTDKELVEALKNVIIEFRCPECKKSRWEEI